MSHQSQQVFHHNQITKERYSMKRILLILIIFVCTQQPAFSLVRGLSVEPKNEEIVEVNCPHYEDSPEDSCDGRDSLVLEGEDEGAPPNENERVDIDRGDLKVNETDIAYYR